MKKRAHNIHKTIAIAGVLCLSGLGISNVAHANAVDEAAQACLDAAKLIQEDDDLEGAIEEATWCLTGLKQLQEEIKLSIFPDELEGFVGGEIENQNVMGMTMIGRSYTRDGDTITLSMMGTSGDGAGPLGALGDLGKLFGAMEGAGAAAGGKKIRIQKRTVVVSDDGGKGSLSISLKSGGTLNVESAELDSDELVDFMREFPIAELDDAMAK